MINPAARLVVARFRLAVARRPDLLRDRWYAREGTRLRELAAAHGLDALRVIDAAAVLSPAGRWDDVVARLHKIQRS